MGHGQGQREGNYEVHFKVQRNQQLQNMMDIVCENLARHQQLYDFCMVGSRVLGIDSALNVSLLKFVIRTL